MKKQRGYIGIALFEPKTIENWGTVVRSAHCFDVDFICTIGNRYKRQMTDTTKGEKHIPFFHYTDLSDFSNHIPSNCEIIPVEVTAEKELAIFKHPERAIYIFGGEDRTLPTELTNNFQSIKIDTNYCLNLAVTASIVMYDRIVKSEKGLL